MTGFACIAHRGAMGYEPENTLLAIRRALELGATWIEIDVHYVDGRLLVIHDDVIEHPVDGKVSIFDHTFDYLRSIRLDKGEYIPTLTEVMGLLVGKAKLNIELKHLEAAVPVCEFVQKEIANKRWDSKDLLISSFCRPALKTAQDLLPQVSRGVLVEEGMDGFMDAAKEFGATYINFSLGMITKGLIESCHAKGKKILIYTVNDADDITKLHQWGADGVFTNYIDTCLRIVRELEG